MAGAGTIFREIHRLRTFAADLQSRITFAPKQLKAQQNLVTKREEELKQGQDAVKKSKVAIHDREVSVKAENQLIKKYETQLNDIHSKKEYDALKHEIAGVQEKIRGFEDQTLTAMMELEERNSQIPALEDAVKKAKAEFAAYERDYQSKLDDWVKQRDDALEKVAAEEDKVPPDIRAHYDRLVKAMGADALSPMQDRNCAACNTELTAQLYHNVLMQQIVMCRSCGRVIYLKDGA